MKKIFTIAFVCLLFLTGIHSWAQQILPTSGEYYLVKNQNSDTYIGGTGTGDNSVKHVAPDSDPDYQVFLISGDNTNGWTMQQQYTGMFITHNNSWVGSFAAVTNTNRQLFKFDETQSNDYIVILKKKDDGTFANGIGYDSATPGSPLYMDKGTGNQNKWLFDADSAASILAVQLTAAITDAQAFHDANSDVTGEDTYQTAITTASGYTTSTSGAEIVQALTDLKEAKIPFLIEVAGAKATAENPVELTSVIVNPSFEIGNLDGWTNNGMQKQTNTSFAKDGNIYCEKYNGSGILATAGIYQVLSGLPSGLYELTINGKFNDTGAFVYANTDSIEFNSDDVVRDYTVTINLTVDTLRLGVAVVDTLQSVETGTHYLPFDNFRLVFKGDVIVALKNKLDEKRAEATALQANFTSESYAYTALANVLTQTETVNETQADLQDAIDLVQASLDEIAVYDPLKEALDAAAAYPTDWTGYSTFADAITAAEVVYNDAVLQTSTAVADAVTALNDAVYAYRLTQPGSEEDPADFTFTIVNPAFDDNTKDGWTGADNGSASYHELEFYKKTFDAYQVITGLPAGKYVLKAQGFERAASNSAAAVEAYLNGTEVLTSKLYATVDGAETNMGLRSVYSETTCPQGWQNADTLYPNSMADAEVAFNLDLYDNELVDVVVGESGTVTIGVKGTFNDGTSGQWILFDNFRLYYLGEVVDLTPLLTELQGVYDAAKAYYDAIDASEVAGAEEGDVPGKYSNSTYSDLATALEGASAILLADPFTGTADDIIAAKSAVSAAKAACVIYIATNELADGEYFFVLNDTLYINNPGIAAIANGANLTVANEGLQKERNIEDASQIFTVAKLSGVDRTTVIDRYSIFSAFEETIDGNSVFRHFTENAIYQQVWGSWDGGSDDDWRTVNILDNGSGYAVQDDGSSASKGCWTFDGTKLTYSGRTSVDVSVDFIFKFVPVKDVFAEEVAAGRAAYTTVTSNTDNIGNKFGQYAQSVCDAFDAALTTAEGIVTAGTATKEDLFTYAEALSLFVPNDNVGISNETKDDIIVVGGTKTIKVESKDAVNVSVYSLAGAMINKVQVTGEKSISVASGLYIVKAGDKVVKVIVR